MNPTPKVHGRRWARAATLGAALATAAGVLAACGSGQGAPGSGGSSSSSLDDLSVTQLASKAAQEGSLTWYTTFSDDDVQPFIQRFNQAYPKVKIKALRLSADKIPPRVITEQRGGKFNADVISGDSPQLSQLIQAGALQAYTPKDLATLPTGLKLPAGYQGVVYVNTTVIAYNPTVVKQKGLPVPKTWEDLTDPKWRGQFSIDPGAVNWYDSLVVSMGHDKAKALLTKLGNNKPVFVESHTQALTQVQAGEPAGAATAYGYKAASLKKKTPTQLQFVNDDPLSASLNLTDIVKNAPHPAAARLFQDWIVSKAGQTAVVEVTNHTSIRDDVKNDPTVWDESTWKPAYGNPSLDDKDYNNELQEMKEALQAP